MCFVFFFLACVHPPSFTLLSDPTERFVTKDLAVTLSYRRILPPPPDPATSADDTARLEALAAEGARKDHACGALEAQVGQLTRALAAAVEAAEAAAAAAGASADSAAERKAASAAAALGESEARGEARAAGLEQQLALALAKAASNQALTLTVNKLNEALKKRDGENLKLSSDKEKLEAYTKKALHNVQDKYMLAIKTCKEQRLEKDERIAKLTDQYKLFRNQAQRESALLSSAVYELGMNITEQRLVRNLDRPSSSSASALSSSAAGSSQAGAASPTASQGPAPRKGPLQRGI